MSTLLVDELFPGAEFNQDFKIFRELNVGSVRPWVYLEGTLADGDFTLEVLDGATLLATSTITHTQINAAKTETYAHGYMRFDFDSLALHIPEGETEKEFTLRFSMQNHTKDISNYLAIARIWDLKFYDIYGTDVTNNEPPNDSVEPAGIEIYEQKFI
jgi:hypothetical protein